MDNYTEVLRTLHKIKNKYETKKAKNEEKLYILKHNNEELDVQINRIKWQIDFIESKQKEEKKND